MKVNKIMKKNRVIAILLCGCLLFGLLISGAATVWGAQGEEGVLSEGAYLRPIKANYLEEIAGKVSADSLEPNSKWREEPLNSKLREVLGNDLSDTSDCEQVWEFKANPENEGEASYDDVHEWCLENLKGEETNTNFLTEFANNRIQYKD